jgi:hypothetical protein
MKLNRRDLLIAGTGLAGGMLLPEGLRRLADAAVGTAAVESGGAIDRRAVVGRHNPVVHQIDPFAALSIGNGNFAFTADVTGLQSFPADYEKEFPLCTAAHWAWHTTPAPAGVKAEDFRYKQYDVHGRKVGYATDSTGQKVLYDWLRENPHRLHLGRIGFLLKHADGTAAASGDIQSIDQTLDLWTGTIVSRFEFLGQAVTVRTCCHPDQDAVAIRIESALVGTDRLAVQIAFPYGSPEVDMADWKSPGRHQTRCEAKENRADFFRVLDQDRYRSAVTWSSGRIEKIAEHDHVLHGAGEVLECVVQFSPGEMASAPSIESAFKASELHWHNFWSTGGAIDLSGSSDMRAAELERRIVLSQYNTALHCSGTMPPPETGLLFNSWYGKSHLEMHWWHGVHFASWGRFNLLANSLEYYHRILPEARAIAVRQGYEGVRWPKMVDDKGNDSPSPIAPLLIWQQPHPIYYAELCYQHEPTAATLAKWSEIVFETAKFIASYAFLEGDRYVLGPPMKTVPENAETRSTQNPTFELAYWRYGLGVAQQWRKRMGMGEDAKWADVLGRLSALPTEDGLYLMQEGMSDTYTKWNWEHPSLTGALGVLPGEGVDRETMRRSLKKVLEVWEWDKCWGWDFPMVAMAAAKLGEGELAVRALMIETVKNRYLPNGHVYQRANLTAYLPANGGLLQAVALMAKSENGFPGDGTWVVRAEGLGG